MSKAGTPPTPVEKAVSDILRIMHRQRASNATREAIEAILEKLLDEPRVVLILKKDQKK